MHECMCRVEKLEVVMKKWGSVELYVEGEEATRCHPLLISYFVLFCFVHYFTMSTFYYVRLQQ